MTTPLWTLLGPGPLSSVNSGPKVVKSKGNPSSFFFVKKGLIGRILFNLKK